MAVMTAGGDFVAIAFPQALAGSVAVLVDRLMRSIAAGAIAVGLGARLEAIDATVPPESAAGRQ
jgi:hypothetical protein